MHRFFQKRPRFDENKSVPIAQEPLVEVQEEVNPPIVQNELETLQTDPGRTKQIKEFHPNLQDEVRKAYLIKGANRCRGYSFPFSGEGSRLRRCVESWFDEFEWLEYSIQNDAVFCLPCYLFKDVVKINGDFVMTGYRGWGRKSRLLAHEGDFNSAHHYKHDCLVNLLDLLLKELNDRFDVGNTELLRCVASLNPSSLFVAFDDQLLVRMVELYPDDFRNVNEVEMYNQFQNYILDVRSEPAFSTLNGIADLCKQLVASNKHKTYFLVHKLLKLALILPVATATVERAFSAMNYVKSELRSRIGDQSLNDCLVTFIERDVFSTVDDDDILAHFQSLKSRRNKM